MRRLIDVLGRTPHRYIVSMGPQAAELELADNMVGAEFLPQTKVIPQVDLVITHGGNNTTTESLHFGKPMIVLPLFWDQYDNAQRDATSSGSAFAWRRTPSPRTRCTGPRTTARRPVALRAASSGLGAAIGHVTD